MPKQRTTRRCHCGNPIPAGRLHCSASCYHAAARRPLSVRLWEKVVKTDTCWIKQGASAGPMGYGVIGRGGKSNRGGGNVYTHVAAWWLATGHWPVKGEIVCHTCDVTRCCRNDDVGMYEVDGVLYERRGHLWLGTVAANNLDMAAKGRGYSAFRDTDISRGVNNQSAKLTDDAVREIRQRYVRGAIRYADIAAEYGVKKAAIGAILRRESWAHVK